MDQQQQSGEAPSARRPEAQKVRPHQPRRPSFAPFESFTLFPSHSLSALLFLFFPLYSYSLPLSIFPHLSFSPLFSVSHLSPFFSLFSLSFWLCLTIASLVSSPHTTMAAPAQKFKVADIVRTPVQPSIMIAILIHCL